MAEAHDRRERDRRSGGRRPHGHRAGRTPAGERGEHDGGEQSPRAGLVEQHEDHGHGRRADDGARVACHRANPPTISRGRSGVAVMARSALVHLKPSMHRPHRLLGDDHHRRRGDQRRGEEGEVARRRRASTRRLARCVDEGADADAHAEQVQQRLDEAAEQVRRARSAGTTPNLLPHTRTAAGVDIAADPTPPAVGDGRPQSTQRRPVRRRNTSSRLLRRTSALSGATPRSCTMSSAFSPSSA